MRSSRPASAVPSAANDNVGETVTRFLVSPLGFEASRSKKLLEKTGVLLFPGTLFGDIEDKYIRLSYLQPINKIEESMNRIKTFLNS